jgi:NAD-dependent deacetylase
MNIFVLTGAGLSAESGLGTFRGKDRGLWEQFDPMKLATPGAFARNPDEVHAFYNMRRQNLLAAEPNEAHRALARLEEGLGGCGSLFLVTQNIDNLHERAGAQHVIHMHGELLKARCTACTSVTLWSNDLSVNHACPHCGETGTLRPDVVWFGEVPLHMDAIDDALAQADLLVSIGTSGSVYPAAGFVEQAKQLGITTCEINLEPSDNARLFERRITDLRHKQFLPGSRGCSRRREAHSRTRHNVPRTDQRAVRHSQARSRSKSP